jgi:hypothetical protein
MPFVPVANTALAEIRVTANGQQCENTLWFEGITDPTVADLIALGGALQSWWTTSVAPLTSSDVQLREILCTSQTTVSSPQFSTVPATPEFGTSTANIVPNNVTMSVSFRTALRGRSFRGRNYIIGLTEDQVAGNSFVAGVTALWQSAYEDIFEAVVGIDFAWVVVSRFSGVNPSTGQPIPRAAGVTTAVGTVLVVDGFVDSARRRLTGRGN